MRLKKSTTKSKTIMPVKKQQLMRPTTTRDGGKAPPPSKAVAAGTKAKLYSSRRSERVPIRTFTLTKEEARRRASSWAMTERTRKMRLSNESSPVIDLSGCVEGEDEEFEVVGTVNATTQYTGVLRSAGRRVISIPSLLRNNPAPRVLFSTTGRGEVLTQRFSYDKEMPAASARMTSSHSPPKPRINGCQMTETAAAVAVKELMEDDDVFYDACEQLDTTTYNQVRTVQAKSENGHWKTVPYYEKGMCVNYVNVFGVQLCTVIAVDLDDCMEPYYTVRFPDGKEKQTDNDHLTLTSATHEMLRDIHARPSRVSVEPDGKSYSTFAPHGDP